ncbi:MAG: hypothetical protein ACPLRA_07065, partial [Candidatus Saccharicenans sp.]
MSRRAISFKIMLFFWLMALARLTALAEESHQNFDLATFLGQILNFVILFGGLGFLLRKPINDYLKNKAEEIA